MSPTEIKAVLFDMGGVVVQLDSIETVLGPSDLASDDIWEAWILCEAVKRFERGRCTVDEFAEDIFRELRLQGTHADFITRFINFPRGLYPGAVAMVRSVPDRIITGILSNTNVLHWQEQTDAETLRSLCDRSYLSYELDMVKPDRDIFDFVVADLALPAENVLFIDDNQINVDGAIAAGLRARLAKGPEQAAAVLRQFQVIPQP